MMPDHRFLVPLDLSDTTHPQFTDAMALGTTLSARLILLHVIDIPHFIQPVLTAYMDAITNRVKQNMNDYRQRCVTASVDAATVLVHGVVWQEIVHIAELKAVDLVIIGKHARARAGVEHALLGSVAEKVVRLAPCPVLVVPSTTPPA